MGLFDKFKKKSNSLTIEEIISKDYNQKYFDECKYIWKNYVPKRGQATNLQGELLREIEKIRCEAQDNGNINWDDDFSYFCDFISNKLSEQSIYSTQEKEEIMENRRLLILDSYNTVTQLLATIQAKAETAALYNAQMKIIEYERKQYASRPYLYRSALCFGGQLF